MNSNTMIKSNYFHVTDRKAFDKLMSYVEGDIQIFGDASDGTVGFYSDDSLLVYVNSEGKLVLPDVDDDFDLAYDAFFEELSKLIPSDDACIVIELDWEGFRSVNAFATVVTTNNYEVVDLQDVAFTLAEKSIGNNNFNKYI